MMLLNFSYKYKVLHINIFFHNSIESSDYIITVKYCYSHLPETKIFLCLLERQRQDIISLPSDLWFCVYMSTYVYICTFIWDTKIIKLICSVGFMTYEWLENLQKWNHLIINTNVNAAWHQYWSSASHNKEVS